MVTSCRKLGTLTVQYAGADAAESGDVRLEDWSAPLRSDTPNSCEYMFSWVAFEPVFIEDAT